jgi:hypothetical protein
MSETAGPSITKMKVTNDWLLERLLTFDAGAEDNEDYCDG